MASVADLVEPDVLRERAGEYLQRAGETLQAAGRVRLVDFGPIRVTAEVDDGGERHATELTATPAGLNVHCDCSGGADGGFCPHIVAAAIETWHRTPTHRG